MEPIYEEHIKSYLISIPIGVLIFLSLIAIVSTFITETNQLIILTLLVLLILLIIIYYNFYKLCIRVTKKEFLVKFGKGGIQKSFHLDDIDTTSIKFEKIPWYYGMGFKLGAGGKTIICAKPGTAIAFKLKSSAEEYWIGTNNHYELRNFLTIYLKEVNLH